MVSKGSYSSKPELERVVLNNPTLCALMVKENEPNLPPSVRAGMRGLVDRARTALFPVPCDGLNRAPQIHTLKP